MSWSGTRGRARSERSGGKGEEDGRSRTRSLGLGEEELREKEAGRGGVERSGMEPPGERSGASCP